MKQAAARVIFFIGWILSPMTSWNDAFVNIPLAYLLASLHTKAFPHTFPASIIAYYWLTNATGIVLAYIGGRELAVKEIGKKGIKGSLLTIILYTVVLALLSSKGVIRPFLHGR